MSKLYNSSVNKRILWIDYSRTLLIIAVMLYHLLITETWKIPMEQKPLAWIYFNQFTTLFFLPAFFFLSGMMSKVRNPLLVLKNSAKRLLPPYFTTCLIWIIVFYSKNDLLAGSWWFERNSLRMWQAIAFGFGTANKDSLGFHNIAYVGAIWFFLTMFLATNLFNLVMFYTQKLQNKEVTRLILFALAFVLIELLQKHIELYLPWTANTAFQVLIIMYFGYLVKDYQFNSLPLFLANTCLLVVYAYFRDGMLTNFGVYGASNSVVENIMTCFGIIWIVQFGKVIERFFGNKLNVLSKIGLYSGVVLSWHLIDLQIIQLTNIFAHYFNQDEVYSMWITVPMRVLIPCIIMMIIVKTPYLRKLWGVK